MAYKNGGEKKSCKMCGTSLFSVLEVRHCDDCVVENCLYRGDSTGCDMYVCANCEEHFVVPVFED